MSAFIERTQRAGRRPIATLALALAFILAAAGCGKKDKEKEKKAPEPAQKKVVTPQADPKKVEPAPTPQAPLPALEQDEGEHSGKHKWSRQIGDVLRDNGRAIDIAEDGTVAVAGLYSGEVDFGGGTKSKANGKDAFVAVYDDAGKYKWHVTMGGKKDDVVTSLAWDKSGNLLVTGQFSVGFSLGGNDYKSAGADDIFVMKLGADGKPVWVRTFGGKDVDAPNSIAVHTDGSVTVAGEFQQTIDFGGGPLKTKGREDAFLLHLDASGKHVWSKSYGDFEKDWARAVATDPHDNVIATFEFSKIGKFGGADLEAVGNRDVAIVKLTKAGAHVWSSSYGTSFNDLARGVAVDPAGYITVAGTFEDKLQLGPHKLAAKGESDVLVTRWDAAGKLVWVKTWGDSKEDIAYSASTDRFGNVVIAGRFHGALDFGGGPRKANGVNKDGFVVKLSPKGEHLWSHSFGGRDNDQASAAAINAKGQVAVTGTFHHTISLAGGKPLKGVHAPKEKAPPGDAFVAVFER